MSYHIIYFRFLIFFYFFFPSSFRLFIFLHFFFFFFYPGDVVLGSPVIDSENTIYIAAGNTVYGIKDNGILKWKNSLIGVIGTSPSLSKDGYLFFTSYFSSSPFNYFYALSTKDGTKLFLPKGFGGGPSTYSSPMVSTYLNRYIILHR